MLPKYLVSGPQIFQDIAVGIALGWPKTLCHLIECPYHALFACTSYAHHLEDNSRFGGTWPARTGAETLSSSAPNSVVPRQCKFEGRFFQAPKLLCIDKLALSTNEHGKGSSIHIGVRFLRDRVGVDQLTIQSLVNFPPRQKCDTHIGTSIKTRAGTLTFFSSD